MNIKQISTTDLLKELYTRKNFIGYGRIYTKKEFMQCFKDDFRNTKHLEEFWECEAGFNEDNEHLDDHIMELITETIKNEY